MLFRNNGVSREEGAPAAVRIPAPESAPSGRKHPLLRLYINIYLHNSLAFIYQYITAQ